MGKSTISMVILTIAMLNGFLVGGANLPSWKMMEFVHGKGYSIYEMENRKCLKPPWYTYPSEKYWKNSHLGWWHSQLNGKIKLMFQTTNQMFFTMEKLRFDLPVCHLWFTRKKKWICTWCSLSSTIFLRPTPVSPARIESVFSIQGPWST